MHEAAAVEDGSMHRECAETCIFTFSGGRKQKSRFREKRRRDFFNRFSSTKTLPSDQGNTALGLAVSPVAFG
jgi:hypothetical protein